MMKTPRRRAREFALQGLYQAQLNPDLSAVTISRNLQDNEAFSKADQELFGQIFHGAINQKADYLALITPLLDREGFSERASGSRFLPAGAASAR